MVFLCNLPDSGRRVRIFAPIEDLKVAYPTVLPTYAGTDLYLLLNLVFSTGMY